MFDNENLDFELYKDGELTLIGTAFYAFCSIALLEHFAHIIFNDFKDGDIND